MVKTAALPSEPMLPPKGDSGSAWLGLGLGLG